MEASSQERIDALASTSSGTAYDVGRFSGTDDDVVPLDKLLPVGQASVVESLGTIGHTLANEGCNIAKLLQVRAGDFL